MSRRFFEWLSRRKAARAECARLRASKFVRDFQQRFPLGSPTSMFGSYRPPDAVATGVHAYWQSPMRDGQPEFLADEILTWIDRAENVRIDAVCSAGTAREYRFLDAPQKCSP